MTKTIFHGRHYIFNSAFKIAVRFLYPYYLALFFISVVYFHKPKVLNILPFYHLIFYLIILVIIVLFLEILKYKYHSFNTIEIDQFNIQNSGIKINFLNIASVTQYFLQEVRHITVRSAYLGSKNKLYECSVIEAVEGDDIIEIGCLISEERRKMSKKEIENV